MYPFGLRRGLNRYEYGAGTFTMENTAVKSHQANRLSADLVGIANRSHNVRRKTGPAMHRNGEDHILRSQQLAHQVHKNIFALGIIGPGGVKRRVVRETASIERSLTGRNYVLGQIAREMLGR